MRVVFASREVLLHEIRIPGPVALDAQSRDVRIVLTVHADKPLRRRCRTADFLGGVFIPVPISYSSSSARGFYTYSSCHQWNVLPQTLFRIFVNSFHVWNK